MIHRLEEILDYENPWIRVYFDRVRFPGGREGRYTRIGEGMGGEGVVILPFTSEGKLAMIRIYRYAVSEWQWEVPRGFSHPGLSSEENARKELEEEVGVSASKLELLGTIYPNTGILANAVAVFLASDVPTVIKGPSDEAEAIQEVRFFGPADVRQMIVDGVLRDGFTLTALSLAGAKGYWHWDA